MLAKSLTPRFWITIAITVISLILIIPTIRYFAFVETTGTAALTPEQKKTKAELQKSAIKLGLDLQGGADFLLALDGPATRKAKIDSIGDELRRALSNDKVPAEVAANYQTESIVVKVTEKKDAEVAAGILRKSEGYFSNPDFDALIAAGQVTLAIDKKQIESYMLATLEGALRVVRKRIDEFGLTQPVVSRQGNDRIRVQIPGESDPDKIQANLLRTAQLEFRLVHPESGKFLANLVNPDGTLKAEYLVDTVNDQGATVKTVSPEARKALPTGWKLMLGEDTRRDPKTMVATTTKNIAYLVKDKVEVSGSELKDAHPQQIPTDLTNPYKVALEFNKEGARKFAKVTRENVNKPFAIILENVVYSAPVIRSAIPDGRCVIEGNFTLDDVKDLSQVLKAGALPAPLRIVEKRSVEASLGADSIVDSIRALGVGGLVLVIFLVGYYGRAGIVAVIAMLLNVALIMAFLSMAGATLTLSGIGGILLTMGMAVDANVLIYERLREELAAKKPIKQAIQLAFGRAFSVIFDSNITSILPALVLLLFEVVSGSIKGFWITLAVGLIANLYTGVAVTRAIIEVWISTRGSFGAGSFAWFRNTQIQFMKLRKIGYVVSGSVALVSFLYVAIHGVNFAVDFTGGVLAHVSVQKEMTTSEVQSALAKGGIADVRVQKVTNKNEFLIRHKLELPGMKEAKITDVQTAIEKACETQLSGAGVKIIGIESIEGEVGSEFRGVALKTLLTASICILLYLAFRFQFVFGVTAVIALFHDIFLSLGIFTLLGREVNMDIISALLIILGYSVNDTIVVYDRIRELSGDQYGKHFEQHVDDAINQSLNRTINTGGTTAIMLAAMLLVGGKGLTDFALILLIGVVFGTYSSTFIASAMAFDWIKRKHAKEEAAKAAARSLKGPGGGNKLAGASR